MNVGYAALHLDALTHTGLVRMRNEDAHALVPHAQTALLADGLGGGRAGEVASALAVRCINESLDAAPWRAAPASIRVSPSDTERLLLTREKALRAAVIQANAAIYQHALNHPACAGMATTLVLAHWWGSNLLVGHVGDSRAYVFRTIEWAVGQNVHRRFELQLLTRDHSTLQRKADARQTLGDSPHHESPDRHAPPRLTRALGVEPDVVLELHRHTINPGDVVLLCSDGLTDMLSEEQIEVVFQDAIGPDGATAERLSTANQALVQAALDAGGHDNITVVLGLQVISPLDGGR